MNMIKVKNSKGHTVRSFFSLAEARPYLCRKGRRGWFIHIDLTGPRIVGQVVIDTLTNRPVTWWPWDIGQRCYCLGLEDIFEGQRLPSIVYATEEVHRLNTFVGYGRYKLVDVVQNKHR